MTPRVADAVALLRAAGLAAEDVERFDPGPAAIWIYLNTPDDSDYAHYVTAAYDFNREDGGWEAAVDRAGEYEPLEDGPGADGSAFDIAHWLLTVTAPVR